MEEVEEIAQDVIEGKTINDIDLGDVIDRNIYNSTIYGGELKVGSGDDVIRYIPGVGFWIGNAEYSSAPFKVDMKGNATMSSVTLTGYLQEGEAAGDVNSGTTAIEPGKVLISGTTHLEDWSSGSDATFIDGGKIYTNSITSTQIDTSSINIGSWAGDSSDIAQDSANQFVDSNEKTGADRAYNGLSSSYKITKGFVESDLSSESAPTNGVKIDSNGIYGYSGGSSTFYINSSGDAYFEGTLGANAGYIGGASSGWSITTNKGGQILSYNNEINIQAGDSDDAAHIKALSDSNNYVQMTADGGTPRVDLYNGGSLRARLSGDGINIYDSNENNRGIISGDTSGYTYFNISDLRVSSGSSEVRIWNDGVRIKNGKGFFCEDETGSTYSRFFVDSSSPYDAIIDLPNSDRLKFQDNSGNAMFRIYGKDHYDYDGLIDCFAQLGLWQHAGTPGNAADYTGCVYYDTNQADIVFSNGSGWYKVDATAI